MFALHESLHNEHGICLWLILTIILIAILVIVMAVHLIRQKHRDDVAKREREEMAAHAEPAAQAAAAQTEGR